MTNRLEDYRLFFGQFRRRFHTTGAVLPSSRSLCKALARFVGRGAAPARILEVGPGTGAVTRYIVDTMGPEDHLDLVEINDAFVRHLRQRFTMEPSFVRVAARAKVIHQGVAELRCHEPYDVIVSGLPLNNFSVDEVRGILAALRRLARDGAMVSFFEYMAVRRVRQFVSGRRQRTRLRGISQALQELMQDREVRREWIWPNVPPAWVHHLRMTGSTQGS